MTDATHLESVLRRCAADAIRARPGGSVDDAPVVLRACTVLLAADALSRCGPARATPDGFYRARGAMLLRGGECIAYIKRETLTLPEAKILAAQIAAALNAARDAALAELAALADTLSPLSP